MPRFILVSFLPETVSYTLKRAREHFEAGVNGKIPPHISLTYPFWSKIDERELIKKIKSASNDFSSFLTTITSVQTFSRVSHAGGVKGKHVIYSQVLPEEPFKKIHDSLQKTLTGHAKFDTSQFPQKTLPSFIPHITLAMNGAEKDVEVAQKMISSVIGYSFMVETILLLKKEEESEKWNEVKAFCLGNKKE